MYMYVIVWCVCTLVKSLIICRENMLAQQVQIYIHQHYQSVYGTKVLFAAIWLLWIRIVESNECFYLLW